jgi:hypothetical protein
MSAEKDLTIFQRRILIQQELSSIGKNQKFDGGSVKYKFRGIDDVMNALNPLLKKHGATITPTVNVTKSEVTEITGKYGTKNQKNIELEVEYSLVGPNGDSCILAKMPGEGFDNGDKATPKALSMAFKYAICQAFCISTEDMIDGDAETTPIETKFVDNKTKATPPKEPVKFVAETPAAKKDESTSFRKKKKKQVESDDL